MNTVAGAEFTKFIDNQWNRNWAKIKKRLKTLKKNKPRSLQ